MSKKVFNFLEILYPFTEDLERKVYGRELARELGMNQKTVQNRLNTLEDEGFLKSVMKGRTKEFELNKKDILARKLIAAAEVRKFYNLLSSSFEVKEIVSDVLQKTAGYMIIYGSFAEGNWGEDSDLDILLINSDSKDKVKKIREKYSREIHFMFMNIEEFIEGIESQEPYIKEILGNHVICKGFEEITDWRCEHG